MDPHETALIQGLLDRGTTIVAAMGNFRQRGSPTQWPGAYPGVVAVGATDPTDTVATFSSRGKHIALCAPGVSIWSTLPTYDGQFGFLAHHARGGRPEPGQAVRRNNDADAWLGTSMATPHVTAAAALLREKMPHLSGAQVRQRLMRTADRVPGMRGRPFTLDYGAGRLNVRRLLAK
jgi:subtilisin family serine protease